MTAEAILSQEIVDWFNARWNHKMGAVDGHDLRFLASLIDETRPGTVVEIGCASGLSTSVMAMMLERLGKASITSFDMGTSFYADPSKAVGYLTAEVPHLAQVEISIVPGHGCLAAPSRFKAETVDFCFIDASHQHPWPLIDTLIMLPLVRAGAYLVHHDPQMANTVTEHATGPKLLQLILPTDVLVPFAEKVSLRSDLGLKTRNVADNIFAIRRPVDIRNLGSKIGQGFLLGWDTQFVSHRFARIQDAFADQLREYLREHYSADVLRCFNVGMMRYNDTKVG